MVNKLFVGGLAWATTDDSLKNLFSQVGTVTSATIIMDRDTGRSKGFGFVEMSSEAEALEAIKKLNGTELDGRKIIVNEARPKPEGDRPGGFSRDFSRGGSRGGGGGGRDSRPGGFGGGNNRSDFRRSGHR